MLVRTVKEEITLTYQCAHVGKTEKQIGSIAVEKRGEVPGIVLELSGVTAITRKTETATGADFEDLDVKDSFIELHIPTDATEVFLMNDRRVTIEIIRWPVASEQLKREVA